MRFFIKSNQGSSLLMILAVLVIVIIFSVTALTIGSASTRQVYNQEMKLQAYYLARSGAHAVASYIVDNPDGLSDSARAAFVSKLVLDSPSEPFKLNPDDEGDIRVTVTRPSSTLLVVSSTANRGGITQTVSVDIHVEEIEGIELTKAAYASGNITMTGSASIDGDIFSDSDITLLGNNKVDGEVYITPGSVVTAPDWKKDAYRGAPNIQAEFPFFSTIVFPDLPDISNTSSSLNVPTAAVISKDTLYTGGISINNGTLTINLGDEDINIVTKWLRLEHGFITVNRPEGKKGRLNVFVLDEFKINSGSKIKFTGKQEGNGRAINIYYKGTQMVTLANDIDFYGLLHVERADITIGGGARFTGSMITGGSKVTIQGNADVSLDMIYAPESVVDFQDRIVKGCIIAKSLNMTGNAKLQYKPLSTDFEEWTGGSSDKTSYTLGNWY